MKEEKPKKTITPFVLCILGVIFTNPVIFEWAEKPKIHLRSINLNFIGEAFAAPESKGKVSPKVEKPGKVIFRINTANPSKEKTQIVPIKVYLPIEVNEEDILDKGGLSLEYDKERSAYYVYKDDLKLVPGETRTFPVKIKNIWTISLDKINQLRKETKNILQTLKQSKYYQEAKQIADKVYNQLDEIVVSQGEPAISTEKRIKTYRSNLKTVQNIKKDIKAIKRLSKKVEKKVKGNVEKTPKSSKDKKESVGFMGRIKNIFGGGDK